MRQHHIEVQYRDSLATYLTLRAALMQGLHMQAQIDKLSSPAYKQWLRVASFVYPFFLLIGGILYNYHSTTSKRWSLERDRSNLRT